MKPHDNPQHEAVRRILDNIEDEEEMIIISGMLDVAGAPWHMEEKTALEYERARKRGLSPREACQVALTSWD